jgi:hypothetical protein
VLPTEVIGARTEVLATRRICAREFFRPLPRDRCGLICVFSQRDIIHNLFDIVRGGLAVVALEGLE